ncbi:Ni/Fe hydrogenase subunit alpha [Candidatus Pacearchaeota archaeon]|nr:Ni/Fe hydrogenase subunit alpha [Candidatus Pacearchaeota archaeon]
MAREINLNHICKIEGHASLNLKIEKNRVIKCELKASEGARFFEALVLGRNIEDIQEIVSRICGICSCSHSVASVQGLEEALGIKPSEQQKFIREILLLAERIRSHATHLYFLSLPDYLGASSAITLKQEHKSKVLDALKIVTLGNKIVEKFGGREMHPFLKIQEELRKENFEELIAQLKETKPLILKTIELFNNLDYQKLERKSEYLSLNEKDKYANVSGKIYAGKETFVDDDYKTHLAENIKEYATSKFVLHNKHTFSVGATARISNNHNQLDLETKKELSKTKITFPITNPHHNLICQALEILNAVSRITELLQSPPTPQTSNPQTPKLPNHQNGTGVSAVEAPRGTLFHEYKINKSGIIEYCNIITPTAQNLNIMESDITLLVNILLEQKTSQKEIVEQIEKLIRSYDPCFSCSTHFLKVNWI